MPEIDFISLGVMGGHGRPWAAGPSGVTERHLHERTMEVVI